MRSYLIAFIAAAGAVAALGGCSSKTADEAGNQADASAGGAQAGGQNPQPAGTSSEIDKLLDQPIDPANDGIVSMDAKSAGAAAGNAQEPAKAQ